MENNEKNKVGASSGKKSGTPSEKKKGKTASPKSGTSGASVKGASGKESGKSSAVKKGGTSASKSPKTAASRNSGFGNQAPKPSGGLSAGTVFLVLLTLIVLGVCAFAAVKFFTSGSSSTDLPHSEESPTVPDSGEFSIETPSPSSENSPFGSFSNKETDPTVSSLPVPTPSATASPSPSLQPSVSPTPDTSSETSPVPAEHHLVVDVPDAEDYVTKSIGQVTLRYWLPSAELDGTPVPLVTERAKDLFALIFDLVSDNYSAAESKAEFNLNTEVYFDGQDLVSLVLRFPTIAGASGGTVYNVQSLNFRLTDGKAVSLTETANRNRLIFEIYNECLNRKIENLNPALFEDDGNLCDGWFLEENTLTLLFDYHSFLDDRLEVLTMQLRLD